MYYRNFVKNLIFCVLPCISNAISWGFSNTRIYTCGELPTSFSHRTDIRKSYNVFYLKSKILGGTYANPNEFRSMVALLRGRNKKFFCGGVIISNRYILTAGHCVSQPVVYYWSDITARVGHHNFLSDSGYVKDYQIQNGLRHPYYSSTPVLNDIAILQTAVKILWSVEVGPVCLPFLNTFDWFEYRKVIITGWGSVGPTSMNSNILKKAQTMIYSNRECNKKQKQNKQQHITDYEFCTYKTGSDSCSYDSGGPVYYTGTRRFLLGIISSGGLCGKPMGINVRITSYLKWIMSSVNYLNSLIGMETTYFEKYPMEEQTNY